jgi:methyltransferase-like protein
MQLLDTLVAQAAHCSKNCTDQFRQEVVVEVIQERQFRKSRVPYSEQRENVKV